MKQTNTHTGFYKRNKENLGLLKFALPSLIFFILFTLLPFVQGFFNAFTDWNPYKPDYHFVGIRNFINLFTGDTYFIGSLVFTLKFAAVSIILQNVAGFILALILDRIRLLKSFLRGVIFLPNILSGVVIYLSWYTVFTLVPDQLYNITGSEFFNISILGDSTLAFWAIVTVAAWMGTGYLMVIYTAGLQTINQTYIEASVIDGAGWWQQLTRIKLPLIMPSFVIGVFLVTNAGLKQFDLSFLLTKGGPYRSTESLGLLIYNNFSLSGLAAKALAQSVVLFVMVALITLSQVYLMKKREVEE